MHSFVAAPERPPHRCIECFYGGPDREFYLDLGDVLEHPDPTVPTVYLCSDCLRAIALEKGLIDAGPLRAEIDKLKEEAFDRKVKAEGLEQALDGLFRARLFSADDLAAVGEMAVDSSGTSDADELRPEGSDVGGGEGAAAQPPDDAQLAGLRPNFSGDAGLRA